MECSICYEKFFTSKHNPKRVCPTPNCNCVICRNCWIKITHKGKNIDEMTLDDIPGIYDKFECPFCRQIDWKQYMNNVFNELQKRVLNEDEFMEVFYKKCFPDD